MTRASRTRTIQYTLGLATICLIGAACVLADAPQWTELGPAPMVNGQYTGRVSALVCSPTNPNLYFAAGADGGVWRTTDGGDSWTPLTDHMPTSAMGALAMDPTDENIIYAGTGEANYANHSRYGLGLYKSVNGGDTWEVLAADVFSGRCFSQIMIDPQNPQRMYASITRAGGFWELAAAKGHPQATGPIGVFRSDDAGVSWTQLTNGLPNLSATDLTIDLMSPNILYAGIGRVFGHNDNGIYKTTDGGDSWTRLAGGLPTTNVGRISVTVAPSSPQRLYAMITRVANAAGGGAALLDAYRSNDGGDNWHVLDTLNGDIQATYGWYLSVVAIHPSNPDMAYFGGLPLYRTTNGGAGFSNVSPPHVDMHAVAWDADGRLIVGSDGGVHRSATGGGAWQARNEGLGLMQCYAGASTHPTDDHIIHVGLQDNGTVRRYQTGYWVQSLGGDGGWTQVDPYEPNYVFAEFQGSGNLYRSTVGGGSMMFSGSGISSSDRHCFMPPYLIDPSDTDHMLYGSHRLYQSLNHGSYWSAYTGDLTGGGSAAIRTMARASSDLNTIYIATNDGLIRVSTDGGENFTTILQDVPGWPRITREIFVHPTDPQTAYLAVAHFGEQQIRRTTNGGQTWEALDANFPDIPVNVVAVDVRGNVPVIYAGTDDTLYRSVNDGASWHRYGAGLATAAVIDLRLQPQRGRMIACTQGRGVWTIPVGLPGDLNGDGAVDAFDIDPFVLALTDPDAYAAQDPTVDLILVGDLNGDGAFDAFDIDPFVQVLTG